MRELLLLALQFIERAQQLLVLLLNFFEKPLRPDLADRFRDVVGMLRGCERHTTRKILFEDDARAGLSRFNGEAIHQPPRADDAEPHSRGRLVAAAHHVVEVRDSGSLVLDADYQLLRTRFEIQLEPHGAMAGIAKGVTNDLGHGSRQARLLGGIEFEQPGNLRRALARGHDVLIVVEVER